MTPSGFKRPTKTEMCLRRRLAEANELVASFLADATGADVIRERDARIKELEAEAELSAKTINKLKAQNANLQKRRREDREKLAAQRREISSLRMDVRVAHSYGQDLELKLEKTESRRFEWATFARRVARELCDVRAENRKLRARLNRSPQNSSLPPSSSLIKKVHNSRVATGRRPGGQPGHIGHGRKQYVPDVTVTIEPAKACSCCGSKDLMHADKTARRLTDISLVCKTVEYIANASTCTKCKTTMEAPFPEGVVNEQNYGNNIRATVTYLVNRCNVSGANATDFLYEVTGHELKVSTGSVRNFLRVFSKKAEGALRGLEGELKASRVVGSDATHTSAAGKQTYVYTFVNDDSAIYLPSRVKGHTPLEASPIADYKGVLVHDHDRAYYNFGGAHAECNVHILRALKGVAENEPERTWAVQMTALLSKANELAKKARDNGSSAISGDVIDEITSLYDAVIELAKEEYERDGPFKEKYKPEGIALSRRLGTFRDSHLLFLHDLSVPYSNNFSERALRRVKMKMKQSGGFRSIDNGQAPYCDFLSIAQTATMRGMEVLGAVRDIYDGKSDLFTKKPLLTPSPDP